MPAYDYRCIECDEVIEVRHAAGERPEITCPSCGCATKRVFSPVGVHFKGSGFHNTDYKAKKPKTTASSETPSCPNKDPGSSGCANCPAAE